MSHYLAADLSRCVKAYLLKFFFKKCFATARKACGRVLPSPSALFLYDEFEKRRIGWLSPLFLRKFVL